MKMARQKEWCEDMIDAQSNLQVGDCQAPINSKTHRKCTANVEKEKENKRAGSIATVKY